LATERVGKPVAIQVIAFLVVAFAVTWAAGSLVLLSNHADLVGGAAGSPRLVLPAWVAGAALLVADLGPTIGALVVVAWSAGRPGVGRWFGQLKRWRIPWFWYVVALLGPTVISLAAVGAFAAAGGRLAPSWFVLQPGRIALTAVGGWAEELGWRGFAQPKLQSRIAAAAAAVVVGVMWNVWHQWMLVAPGGAPFAWGDAGWSLLYMISVSVLMAWIYNSTRASLPSAIAAHVGINAVRFNPYPVGLVSLAFAVAALIVTVITGPASLVRRGASAPNPLAAG
jgi:membrane protease YdiL (CAAX protease family)